MIDSVDRRIGELLLSERKKQFMQILSVKERVESSGYCETCYYEDIFLVVQYMDYNENIISEEFYEPLIAASLMNLFRRTKDRLNN